MAIESLLKMRRGCSSILTALTVLETRQDGVRTVCIYFPTAHPANLLISSGS